MMIVPSDREGFEVLWQHTSDDFVYDPFVAGFGKIDELGFYLCIRTLVEDGADGSYYVDEGDDLTIIELRREAVDSEIWTVKWNNDHTAKACTNSSLYPMGECDY